MALDDVLDARPLVTGNDRELRRIGMDPLVVVDLEWNPFAAVDVAALAEECVRIDVGDAEPRVERAQLDVDLAKEDLALADTPRAAIHRRSAGRSRAPPPGRPPASRRRDTSRAARRPRRHRADAPARSRTWRSGREPPRTRRRRASRSHGTSGRRTRRRTASCRRPPSAGREPARFPRWRRGDRLVLRFAL